MSFGEIDFNEDVLIVDDEASVTEVVGLYLKREGFQVRMAADGLAALAAIEQKMPDLLVLDLMLPQLGGMELMRRLRQQEGVTVPVILLTARSQEIDRIYGLEMGADDYVTKPFSPAELVARVKAVLRRTRGGRIAGERPLSLGPLQIDPLSRQVELDGKLLELTATEFNLLYFFGQHPRQVFTRDQLLEHVWGFSDYVDPSTVTVHIRRLREKLEIDPGNPVWIVTVWGVGYKFDPATATAAAKE